ncbi:hypothetical protein GOODEAATRI_014960 [Goodea atripinnis]|uniref:Uncharacterized protein n=1 Tax=Goodea atripinnis TaxID=208336 RepID=A0ABV0NY18_9TELE
MYLQEIKHISSIQAVVTESVQQLHLGARWETVERPGAERVGLPLFQLPSVADDVIKAAPFSFLLSVPSFSPTSSHPAFPPAPAERLTRADKTGSFVKGQQ